MHELVAAPLRFAYAEWGGTDEVMRLLQAAARESLRPAIVLAFDEALERDEAESQALRAKVQEEQFQASRDLANSTQDSRLDKLLLQLNEAISKHTVDVAAGTLQRVFREKKKRANRPQVSARTQPPATEAAATQTTATSAANTAKGTAAPKSSWGGATSCSTL